jgi:hypothetical protein
MAVGPRRSGPLFIGRLSAPPSGFPHFAMRDGRPKAAGQSIRMPSLTSSMCPVIPLEAGIGKGPRGGRRGRPCPPCWPVYLAPSDDWAPVSSTGDGRTRRATPAPGSWRRRNNRCGTPCGRWRRSKAARPCWRWTARAPAAAGTALPLEVPPRQYGTGGPDSMRAYGAAPHTGAAPTGGDPPTRHRIGGCGPAGWRPMPVNRRWWRMRSRPMPRPISNEPAWGHPADFYPNPTGHPGPSAPFFRPDGDHRQGQSWPHSLRLDSGGRCCHIV